MSIPRPHHPYFLIRVSKLEEKKRKEKSGNIYIPNQHTYMEFNTQCGEIIDIGTGAASYFPEARIGHILLIHHFCQSANKREAKANHLIHEDKSYNYYVVAAYAFAGKDCEAYGVWDGEKIIPNKDYVFLEVNEIKTENLSPEQIKSMSDEKINSALKKTSSGLLLFDNWKESRDEMEERQKSIKAETQELSKSGNHKSHIQQAILGKEQEMENISRAINKQFYKPVEVAYANKELSEWFGRNVIKGSTIGMLNMSVHTKLTFNGETYIVAKTKFIACLFDIKNAA